jgi:hypothetical protein
MGPPSNSVEPVTERITTRRLAEQHHEHHNFGVPRTSECFRNPLRRTLLRGPGLEYAPTQPHAGPPTDPMPENELFMLTSATSQDDDPLAFLSLDIPCRAYVTGASPTKISTGLSRSTPLASATVTATVTAAGETARWQT